MDLKEEFPIGTKVRINNVNTQGNPWTYKHDGQEATVIYSAERHGKAFFRVETDRNESDHMSGWLPANSLVKIAEEKSMAQQFPVGTR